MSLVHSLGAWIDAHPLLAYLTAGAVLSTLWYRVRAALWPGLETSKLPTWGRLCQALVETILNLPGAVASATGRPGLPPGAPPAQPPAPPSSGQSGRSTVALAAVLTLLLALGLAVSGCDPSQHDPQRWGSVSVYVAPSWSARDRGRIGDELVALRALGPAFTVTEASDEASVVVMPWESPDCQRAAGQYVLGTRVAQVDPTCTPGDTAFRAAIGHEVGHVLGMLHVCLDPRDGPDCSPSVSGRPAMMARSPFEHSGDDTVGLIAVDAPTALDLQEYSRVRGAR